MQALVHFTVGVIGALLVLTVVDWPVQQEFLLLFASGFWGLIPDGHWVLREFGIEAGTQAWRAFHRSVVANVFWFHHAIDGLETGRNNLEAGIALLVLGIAVGSYYRHNDWTVA